MSHYTTSSLIESIKRRAAIPVAQETFQTSDFLAFANEEIALGLLPSIMRLHEDYLLYTEEIDVVANQSRYTIPHRAIGNKLRELAYKDNNGNIFEMTRINIEDLPAYNSNGSYNGIHAYYVEYDEIVLVPQTSTATGVLVMTYYLRPNELVEETHVSKVLSVNVNTGEVSVDNVPSDFTSSSTYDVIKGKSPFKTLALDLDAVSDITSINSLTKVITFSLGSLPTNLAAGDYICLAEQTVIPQIPSELHVVLAHRVASRCLEAMGDVQALQAANAKLEEMEQNTSTIIDNRVEGSPKKVVARHSPLRQGLFRHRYRYKG